MARLTPDALAQRGIALLDPARLWFRCLTCLRMWSPDFQAGGQLPRGWWRCPAGCNGGRNDPEG